MTIWNEFPVFRKRHPVLQSTMIGAETVSEALEIHLINLANLLRRLPSN
jgi:hypothetical protein